MRTLTPYLTKRSLASDLWSEMDRMFVYDERRFEPATDITENEENYLLSVDLPGLKKEDIKIEVHENMLTISGERKGEFAADKKQKVQRYEKSYGFFKRSFTLPNSVHTDKIEARYESGVLELRLPKTPAAQSRQIEIQ